MIVCVCVCVRAHARVCTLFCRSNNWRIRCYKFHLFLWNTVFSQYCLFSVVLFSFALFSNSWLNDLCVWRCFYKVVNVLIQKILGRSFFSSSKQYLRDISDNCSLVSKQQESHKMFCRFCFYHCCPMTLELHPYKYSCW